MRAAVGAQRDAPGISRKPGVFRRGCADGGTTGRRAKAADVIGDPVGIGEGMLMPSLHGNAFVLVRDGVTAGGAEQAFFFLCVLCGGFIHENRVNTPVKPYNRLCEISPLAKKPTSGMSPSSWRMARSSAESSPHMCTPRPRHE